MIGGNVLWLPGDTIEPGPVAPVQHFFTGFSPVGAGCNVTSHQVGAGLQAFWQFRRFWPRGQRSYLAVGVQIAVGVMQRIKT